MFQGYERRSRARQTASAFPGQRPAGGSRVRIKLQVTQRWRCLGGGCKAGAEPRPRQEGERGRGREPDGSGARGKPSQVPGWRAARCRHRGELQPSSRSPLPRVAPCNAKSIRLNGSGMTAQAYKVVPCGKIPFPNKQLAPNGSALHGDAAGRLAHGSGFWSLFTERAHKQQINKNKLERHRQQRRLHCTPERPHEPLPS